MSEAVPAEVRRLLGIVDTYEKLELLALTLRQPEMIWTLELAAARLRLTSELVAPAVDELTSAGLLACNADGFRIAGADERDRAAAELLGRMYEADRFSIMQILSALAYERIRTSAARAFAAAFRLKSDPGKGGKDG